MVPLEGSLTLGRHPDCWLQISADLVSRVHAELSMIGECLMVKDRGSRNGTYVNGEKISGQVELRPGDELRIGRETIHVARTSEEDSVPSFDDLISQTMGMGDNAGFASLVGQLVDKSLKLGKIKEAERYLRSMNTQIRAGTFTEGDPTILEFVRGAVGIAEHASDFAWMDRVLLLFAEKGWVLTASMLTDVERMAAVQANLPLGGLEAYETMLRGRVRREPSPELQTMVSRVAALRDAH